MSPCLKNSSMHLENPDVTACDDGDVNMPGGPLVVQVPGLGRVWHVTRVQQQREDTWLIKARGRLISWKEAFHLLQLAEVHWHVWTVDTISFIHLQHRANLVSPLCANSLFFFRNWPNRYMLSEITCSDVFCWVKYLGDFFGQLLFIDWLFVYLCAEPSRWPDYGILWNLFWTCCSECCNHCQSSSLGNNGFKYGAILNTCELSYWKNEDTWWFSRTDLSLYR